MAETIDITSIATKLASTIQATDTMVVMSPDGDVNQTPIFEAVAKANGENGCVCVKTVKLSMTDTEVKALDSTPQFFGVNVTAGHYARALSADLIMNYNSAAYVSMSPIIIVSGGVTVLELPVNVIDSATDIAVQFEMKTGAASQVQLVDGADFSILSIGTITTGDSPIDVYITYLEIPL